MDNLQIYIIALNNNITGTDAEIASKLNTSRTAPDIDTEAITWGSLTINHGSSIVLTARAILNGLIAAAPDPQKDAFVLLNEQLKGNGIRVGLPNVRQELESYRVVLAGNEQALFVLDMLLDEATEKLIDIEVTELQVIKGRLIYESETNFDLESAQILRTAEEQVASNSTVLTNKKNEINSWDGQGTIPATYGE